MEALQVLKSLIKGKEMFRVPPSTSILLDDDDGVEAEDAGEPEEGSWDDFLDDAPDNYEPDVSVE